MAIAAPFEDAKAAFERGDAAAAFKLFKPLAEEGDASAQFWLGQMYDLGKGVPQNLSEASLWYRRAAEQGNVMAQHNLGHMYESGEGTKVSEYSLTAAASWYRRAAERDYKPSQANLGALYAAGRGVRRDFVEAYMWMLLAGSIAENNREALAKRMQERGIKPEWEVFGPQHILQDVTRLIEKGYDEKYGARPLRRAVEHYLEDPLAEALLKGEIKDGEPVLVAREGEKLVFRQKTPPAAPSGVSS